MKLRKNSMQTAAAAVLLSAVGVSSAHAQEAAQTSVNATRAFVRDSCPVMKEELAGGARDGASRGGDGITALGLGAQFLTSLADSGWGMVANAFERAGKDATYSVDAGVGYDFYQTRVGAEGALGFTMRGNEIVAGGEPLTVGDQTFAPTRRYRCLVVVSGQFGYSPSPIDMGVELNGHWDGQIVRSNAGETLQHMGLAAPPDLYIEALIMEDQALGSMAVHPILVRYARPLAGLRGNRQLDATLSLVFSKTPTLARSTDRDEADVFAALLIEFGALRPGTLLGPLELSGAGISGLPMRPTDDDALTFVREDFTAVADATPETDARAAQRLAAYRQGVGVAPVWVEAAFIVTRPGNPFMRAVGDAMKDTREEARQFFDGQFVDRARRYESRGVDRENARRDYELAMIDVQAAELELSEAEPGSAEALQARRVLIEKQYAARQAARGAGLPEPNWR